MKPTIQLHDGETILFETQPKKALLVYRIITGLLRWFFFFAIMFFTVYFQGFPSIASIFHFEPNHENWLVFAEIVTVVIFVLAVLIYYWMNSAIQKHWYFITNERCINFAGFWGINKQIILFSNIVDVNVRQNPLETLLGLSSVTVDAPGLAVAGRRSRGSIIIAGLTAESAEKISHLIGEQMRNARKK